jgi:hypothetical protein
MVKNINKSSLKEIFDEFIMLKNMPISNVIETYPKMASFCISKSFQIIYIYIYIYIKLLFSYSQFGTFLMKIKFYWSNITSGYPICNLYLCQMYFQYLSF